VKCRVDTGEVMVYHMDQATVWNGKGVSGTGPNIVMDLFVCSAAARRTDIVRTEPMVSLQVSTARARPARREWM
jgi:hypothetical protein